MKNPNFKARILKSCSAFAWTASGVALVLCASLVAYGAEPGNEPPNLRMPQDHCLERQPVLRTSDLSAHACGNGMCVKLSYDGRLWTSKDGHAWTEQPLPMRPFLRSVTFGEGIFVAVGGSYIDLPGVIMTSQDGTTWIRRHSQNRINLHSVVHGQGLFVAVGDKGTLFTSRNGVCWKKRCSGTSATLAAANFGKGIFVAGGEAGTILTSTNGVAWTNRNLGDSLYVGKLFFRDGVFVAPNSEATFTSVDGLVWSRRDTETAKIP